MPHLRFRARVAILMFSLILLTYFFIYLIHKVEEQGKHGYYSNYIKGLPVNSGRHPILLWWTPFTGEHGSHRACGNEICYFTDDRKYLYHELTWGLLFYGSDFKPTDLPLPRLPNHEWALLHEESPKNNYLFSTEKVMNLFNHTSTFRRTSDMPLVLQYLDSLESLTSLKYYVPMGVKNSKLRSLSPVVYVHSDCDTPSDRDSYIKELMEFIKIDSYGKCVHNKDLPLNLTDPLRTMFADEFLHIVAQYKFTLSFENAVCEDYITEKLWRPLSVGSVPVYYGSPTVEDWLPNPDSAVIVSKFRTPKQLAEHLLYLNENDVAYEKYLRHKTNREVTNGALTLAMEQRAWGINNDLEKGSFIDHFECIVCQRISQNFVRRNEGSSPVEHRAGLNHYGCPKPVSPLTGEPNPQSWWLELYNKAFYEARAVENLIRSGRNFTSDEFFREVIRLLESGVMS